MEDIIDIIVTETTNLIEITSQPTDEIIDVNIIDNREDVTLNVTPTLVEININSLTGNFGILWGEIEGTLSNQTDLQNALNLKADLVDGKVPSSQLPSYVDDVVEVANYAALPVTGEVGKIYITLDTNYIYRWTGSVYVEIKDSSAVWGAITGTLSNQTDLQNALNLKANDNAVVHLAGAETITGAKTFSSAVTAPNFILSGGTGNTGLYYGHTDRVVLANYTAGGIDFEVNGGSIVATLFPSGNYGLGITLDAGYKLDVNGTTRISGALSGTSASFSSSITASSIIKSGGTSSQFLKADGSVDSSTYATTSQLHNPVTIGTANGLSLSTQVLSLGLASSSTNGALSSTDWTTFNNKQAALSGTGFVKISGTTISYDNSTYLTTSSAASTYVSGSGVTDYYARFTNTKVIADGFIRTTSNITYVEGMGLSTGNGLDIQGNYGAGGGGLKIRSYDETTGNAYIDFANTGGRMYLGLNRSTAGGLMTNATAYATVLTTGLGTSNLEFGTNATKRVTIDGTTGAVTLTSALSGTSATFNATLKTKGLASYDGIIEADNSSTTGGGIFRVKSNGTTSGFISVVGSALGNTNRNLAYYAETDLGHRFYVNGGTQILDLPSSGAATFSSGVKAAQLYTNSNAAASGFMQFNYATSNTSSRSWRLANDNVVYGDFAIQQSTTQTGTTFTNLLYINPSGNVGIGTTSPTEKLSLFGSTSTTFGLSLEPSGWNGAKHRFSVPVSGDTSMLSFNYNGSVVDSALYGTSAINVLSGVLYFSTGTTNTAPSERMRITSSGNVGIGTTSPTGKLQIETTSGSTLLRLSATAVNTKYLYTLTGGADDAFTLSRDHPTGGGLDIMTWTYSGKVGIGTTSPNGGLTVVAPSSSTAISLWGRAGDNYSALRFQSNTGATTYSTIYTNASDLIFENGGSERMRITSGGDVLINKTSLSAGSVGVEFERNSTSRMTVDGGTVLLLNRLTSDGTIADFRRSTTQVGSISVTTVMTSYNVTSDYRLKEDLKPINGLDIVNKIKVYDYKWKADNSRMDGVLAHELQEVLPYAVIGIKDGEQMQQVDYSKIVPVMVQAIKDLKAELDTLKNK